MREGGKVGKFQRMGFGLFRLWFYLRRERKSKTYRRENLYLIHNP